MTFLQVKRLVLAQVSPRVGQVAHVDGKRWRVIAVDGDKVRVKSQKRHFYVSVKTWLMAKKYHDLDLDMHTFEQLRRY